MLAISLRMLSFKSSGSLGDSHTSEIKNTPIQNHKGSTNWVIKNIIIATLARVSDKHLKTAYSIYRRGGGGSHLRDSIKKNKQTILKRTNTSIDKLKFMLPHPVLN